MKKFRSYTIPQVMPSRAVNILDDELRVLLHRVPSATETRVMSRWAGATFLHTNSSHCNLSNRALCNGAISRFIGTQPTAHSTMLFLKWCISILYFRNVCITHKPKKCISIPSICNMVVNHLPITSILLIQWPREYFVCERYPGLSGGVTA